jgi:hypothetical protein
MPRTCRRWLLGAVPLLAGLLLGGNPSPARAHWMGDAFNGGLVQAIDQVMDLVVIAGQQGQDVPGLNKALEQLVKALTHQGHGHKHHHHRGGFAGGLADCGGMLGDGPPLFPPGGMGGPAFGANAGGCFANGMQQVGGGAGGRAPRGGGDAIRVNGNNNIVINGNRGNVLINNGDGNSHLNAGGRLNGGMQQAGAGQRNRPPAAPVGADLVAMNGGAAKNPLAKPGMLLGDRAGQRRPDVPLGGARGPIIGDRRPVPGQGAALLGGAGKKNDLGAALKPVGGMVGSGKPVGPGGDGGKRPAEQQANKPPAVGGLTGGIKMGARVGANAGVAAVVAAKSSPSRGAAPLNVGSRAGTLVGHRPGGKGAKK